MNAFSNDIVRSFASNGQTAEAALWAELFHARAASASRQVGRFYRNAATYELLLLLAIADGSDEASIYNTVEAVESTALGKSALLKFIREQVDAGNLHLEQSCYKRSKWIVRPDPSLAEELSQLLERRSRLLAGYRDHQRMKTCRSGN